MEELSGIFDEVVREVLEDEVALYEIKLLYDQRLHLGIGIYPDKGRAGSYFKVFNGKEPDNSTLLARISFQHPYYEHHYEDSSQISRGRTQIEGKQSNWYLTTKEKRMLINLLNSPYKNDPRITNWEKLIRMFNDAAQTRLQSRSIRPEDIFLPLDLEMPPYMDLPKNRTENDTAKRHYANLRRAQQEQNRNG